MSLSCLVLESCATSRCGNTILSIPPTSAPEISLDVASALGRDPPLYHADRITSQLPSRPGLKLPSFCAVPGAVDPKKVSGRKSTFSVLTHSSSVQS